MRKLGTAFVMLGMAAFSLGCGQEAASAAGQGCDAENAPASCGMTCGSDESCGQGTYCGTGSLCIADCVLGSTSCGDGKICSSQGRCVVNGAPSDGGTPFDRDGACAVLGSQATLEKQ